MRILSRITFISCLFLLISCNKEEAEYEYGLLSLKIDSEKEITVSAESRGAATDEELADYLITLKQGEDVILDKVTYSSKFTDSEAYLPLGEGYVLWAESCTTTDAEVANDSWGKARFYGISDEFNIISGKKEELSIICSMQNAKVSVNFEKSFMNSFTDYSVEVYENSNETRKLCFTSLASSLSPVAYFNIDDDPELNYVIKGTLNGSGVKELASGSIKLKKAYWSILNIKSADNGNVSIDISVDNTVEDVNTDIDVNPYN